MRWARGPQRNVKLWADDESSVAAQLTAHNEAVPAHAEEASKCEESCKLSGLEHNHWRESQCLQHSTRHITTAITPHIMQYTHTKPKQMSPRTRHVKKPMILSFLL